MSLYAVVGNPVTHSKSPRIHQMFAEQTGLEMEYVAITVESSGFSAFVHKFFDDGGQGLNVTVPFKEAAYELADQHAPRAALAKSVNTLFLDGSGVLCGDNTDGLGLARDIQENNGFSIQDKRVLMLGAGGAVRGVLAELINYHPQSITLLNRTLSRAETLAEEFATHFTLEVQNYHDFSDASFDLIINGTTLSLSGELPALDPRTLADGCCCYDMMYGDEDTVFVTWAKDNGAALALDGLGMLVEQAAESFAIWRGVHPQTAPVIKVLRH